MKRRRSLLKKHLEIDTQTCGKWGIDHMVKILKEYPQTNFTEWQLLKVTHSEQHDQDAWVNMVCKVWYPLFDPWNRVMCDWTIGGFFRQFLWNDRLSQNPRAEIVFKILSLP